MAEMTAGTACDWADPYLWAGGTSLPIHSLLGALRLAVQTLNNNISFPRLKWFKEIKKDSNQEVFSVTEKKKNVGGGEEGGGGEKIIIYHAVLFLR